MKLEAGADFELPDLGGALVGVTGDGAEAPGPSVVPLGQQTLTATYWDTEDLRLSRGGLSLRHRRADDGSELGWTVKLPSKGEGGPALSRTEIGFAGPEGQPPAEAVALVTATTRGRPLQPVARLVTTRRRSHVVDGAGRVALEVADDEVAVLDGEQQVSGFRELEVEVAPGEHDGDALLPLVVEQLRDAGAGAPGTTSKIVRALGPRAAEPPDVVPELGDGDGDGGGAGATAGDVARAAIATGTRRLVAHDPGVRLGGDDEDIHQARVATRRLRSDLATFGRLLDEAWVDEVRAELAWVAGELGAARDADVLLGRLQHQADQLGKADAAAATALLRSLEAERAEARGRAAAALATPRYVALLDRLVAAGQSPPLTEAAAQPAAEALPDLVARSWRKLRKAVDRVGDEDHDELLHEVRKKAKRCRYACEAVAPAVGQDATKLAGVVAGLQEVLGDLQDAAVAELWLRSHALGQTGSDAASRAFSAGLLTAVQQHAADDARRRWRPAWKKASKKKRRAWLS